MATRGMVARLSLCVLACAFLAGAAHAGDMVFRVDDNVYHVSGCTTFTDGDMLVPATACRDMLEGGLTWNEELQAVVFHAPPTRLTFFRDKNRVLVNGEEMFLTHRPAMRGGRMWLPLGFVCESVGVKMTRVSPSSCVLSVGDFPGVTSPDERKPLEITVSGVRYTPETYRCLPTCDQLRIAAEECAEMFAGEASWDPELGAAILVVDGSRLVFFENKKTAMVDGMPFELSRKPVLSKVKLLIPFDSLCEMLSRGVDQVGAAEFVVGEPNQ